MCLAAKTCSVNERILYAGSMKHENRVIRKGWTRDETIERYKTFEVPHK